MRIASAEAFGFTFDHGREPLSYCLVRVVTDDGITGWGEACDSFGCTYASVIETTVADAFAPLLVGEELDTIERLMHKLRSWTRRRLGHTWVASQALSGLELALWDALGKAQGEPVAVLLGGSLDQVPLYASSVFLGEGDADWHLDLLGPLLAAGVRAVKLRIGVDWQSDLQTLAAIRDRLGPGVALMIDGNENFTVATALAVAEGLADIGIGWFEEPVLQESPPAMEAVAAGSPVPIACGEHMFGRRVRGGDPQGLGPRPAARRLDLRRPGRGDAHRGRRPPRRPPGWCPTAPRGRSLWLPTCTWPRPRPPSTSSRYAYPLAECWAALAPSCPLLPDRVTDGALGPPSAPGLGVEIDFEAVQARPYQPPAPRAGPSPRFAGNV